MFQKSKEGINKEITGCRYFKFPEDTIHELIDEYRFTSREVKAPSKKMPVIFRSSATWSLVYRLLEGVNGENWVRGITPLKERVGEKIFGDNITFIDDPEMDYAIGATPFDDEGFPTRKKVIVENGVLKNFIFDLSSGAKSGKGSTGNGIKRSMWTRGIEEPPNPRFNNLVLLPGDWELEDMIKDMGEGVIVNDVIGFHSGNILQGQYSMNVGIGFYVKGGEIQGRVVDTMISGNVYDDFFRVRGLGKKIEYNPQVYSPDMYFSEIQVSGKG